MPTLGGRFLYDDIKLIVLNTDIRELGKLGELLRSGRPVRALTFVMDYRLWGYNPVGYHATNLALHLCASSMLFIFLFYFFKDFASSLAAAALFVAHPAGVEAVAAVSHRKEMLALIFMLASLLAYYKASRPDEWKIDGAHSARPSWPFYGLSLLLYMLALGSKQVAIVAPVLMIAMDVLKSGGRAGEAFEKRWFLYLPPILLPVTLVFLSAGDWRVFAVFPPEMFFSAAWIKSLGVSAWAVTEYVKLMLWPAALSVDHAVPPRNLAIIVFGVLTVCGLAWGAWKMRTKALLSFGLAWIPVNLLPVLNIIPANELFSERYLYIPLAGFCMALSSAFYHFSRRNGYGRLFKGLALAWFVTLAALGWKTFMTRHIQLSWLHSAAVVMVGLALLWGSLWAVNRLKIRGKFILRMIVAAVVLAAIVKTAPRFALAHNGQLVMPLGYWDMLDYYEHKSWGKIGFDPSYKDRLLRPGDVSAIILILFVAGLAAAVTLPGKMDERRRYMVAALLAVMLLGAGAHKRAWEWRTNNSLWSATFKSNPESVRSLVNMGIASRRHSNYRRAMWAYRRAASLAPDDPLLHYNLAIALLRLGRNDEARAALEKTLSLEPENQEARLDLGNIYMERGDSATAIRQYEGVVSRDPANAKAWMNLAIAQGQIGNPQKSHIACRKALMAKPDYRKALLMCGPGAPQGSR